MTNGLVPRAGLTLLLTGLVGGVLVRPRAQNLEDVIPSSERKLVVAIATGQGEQKVGFDEDRLAKDLQKGAEDARANDSRFELLPSNDENNKAKAASNALILRSDPRVLAVVGHMLSSTTRAAAEIYADAGIPLLMPTATGISAPYPAGISDDEIVPANRLQNAFRLPASDDRAQVPTIAYVISKLNPSKVHLIAESEEKSKAYSFPLIHQLEKILTFRGLEVEMSDLSSESVSQRAEEIYRKDTATDVIVVAGYTTLSKKLLSALDGLYAGQQEKKPKLIFTEGASNIQEDARGFTIFRTGYRDTNLCKSSDAQRSQKHSAEYTYGFDAVSIIKQALDQCSEEISRSCLTKELRNKPFFAGACEYYSFQNGDNILSNYYVFASDSSALAAIGHPGPGGRAAAIPPQLFLPFLSQ